MKRAGLIAAGWMLMAQTAPAPDFTIGGEAFAQADILDARAIPEIDGSASIMVTLNPKAAPRLARVARGRAGQPLPVRLDGAEIAAPRVVDPIGGGVISLTGSFTLPQAEAMARRISGKDPVPEEFAE